MDFIKEFKQHLFTVSHQTFEDHSLALFDYQFHQNDLYQRFCKSLKKNPKNVKRTADIPFLPIEFFKNHAVKSGQWDPEKVFKSSGTTSSNRSNHHIADLDFYHDVSKRIFEQHFGDLSDYILIALLPSYLEQGDSSLIKMMDHFISFANKGSGYFFNKEIPEKVSKNELKILFGVTYALLDLAETDNLNNTIIIETGGMKGRRKELIRKELHEVLANRFDGADIWSEYGMTELLSQAYGRDGALVFPSWAKVLIREVNDPFSYLSTEKTGGINVIDLANIQTCAFIETKDLGKMRRDGTFEVLGRFDNSDIRGCNLMV